MAGLFGYQTGFEALMFGNIVMIIVGLLFIYLAISKKWEPYELLPIGFGIILVNLASAFTVTGLLSPEEPGSAGSAGLFWIFLEYGLFRYSILPQLIFLCLGAMTDFGPLLSNPKTFFLGAAAQIGIFTSFLGALALGVISPDLGFSINEACAIGIIGGADGPTTIYTTSRLAPEIIGITAVAAYSYMAMVAVIQPPIVKALTTEKERKIKMKQLRDVSKNEKIIFPLLAAIVIILLVPTSAPLVGMFMFGNLIKESGVVNRLSDTAQNDFLNVITIILMLCIGASMPAKQVLQVRTLLVLGLGLAAFAVGTASGVIFAKIMNLFVKEKVNPIIGAAGVSAVPMAARVAQHLGREADPRNNLLMHAMGPNMAGVVGSTVAAGVFLGMVTI